jgi:hypothetical protein
MELVTITIPVRFKPGKRFLSGRLPIRGAISRCRRGAKPGDSGNGSGDSIIVDRHHLHKTVPIHDKSRASAAAGWWGCGAG